jgi:starvation-inducible DNA-binding protein
MATKYTVPGMTAETAAKVTATLQHRLTSLIDLHLTLKHIHWNVVGPNFIGVHEMLDPQVEAVRAMTDGVAERIATMGAEPVGTPGFVAKTREWDDYGLNRAGTNEHLAALDLVYNGVIGDHRKAIAQFDELDLVSQDMLIEQTDKLELFQWFVRAHLEDRSGRLAHSGASSQREAVESVDQPLA